MSTDEKIIKNKVGLLKLSELLGSVSEDLQGHGLFPRQLLEFLTQADPHEAHIVTFEEEEKILRVSVHPNKSSAELTCFTPN